MSDAVELRGSTRAHSLATDRRGGARAGAGRKRGGKNAMRKGWDAWVADIQAVTRSEFRREKLRELARADAWRYLERIAIPLALRSQPGTLAIKDENQMALPLVFVEGAVALSGDEARGREAEILGGGEVLEGEVVRG